VVWGAAVRRFQDDAEAIGSAHTYDFNCSTDTTASAAGELSYPTITFTNGADMDSWADGEIGVVRIERVGGDAADTLADCCYLWTVRGQES
jgi:hypothetical protein